MTHPKVPPYSYRDKGVESLDKRLTNKIPSSSTIGGNGKTKTEDRDVCVYCEMESIHSLMGLHCALIG